MNFDEDIWYTQGMRLDEYRNNPCHIVKVLKFDNIDCLENKRLLQIYVKHLIEQTPLTMSTITQRLFSIRRFFGQLGGKQLTVMSREDVVQYMQILSDKDYLVDKHPEIVQVADVNREIALDYLGFVRTEVNLAPRTKDRISQNFFEVCRLLGFDGMPNETLFYNDDYISPVKTLPKFYDETVIEKINVHLEKVPVQIARMFYVLQNIGMRISEPCELNPDCLKLDADGDYVLTYYQAKTGCNNRLPVKKDVADAILAAIGNSRESFGANTVFVFAKSETAPISMDNFSYHMNRLIWKENICDETGKLVKIRPHILRGTVATAYANAGLTPNLMRTLLGQRSFGALRHYVEIHEKTVAESMEKILEKQDKMIANIGKDNPFINENMTAYELPNGQCVRDTALGICNVATACY